MKIGDLLTWSSNWPKEWLFSVQSSSTRKSDSSVSKVVQQDPKSDSSVSKVVQQLPCWIEALQGSKIIATLEQGYPQATPEEGWCPRLWIDTHLLEMKIRTNYGVKRWSSVKSKDDPVPSQDQCVSGWTQGPKLPTKVSFKGGSHLGNPKPSFFLASPISGTRFILRVVVCKVPRFYQNLEWFFIYFSCIDWNFTRI
jgi:hypothetical protein